MINGPAGYDPIQGGMRTEMKAGPGIDISHGTISTTGEAGVPYVGGTGIYIHGATVEADLDPGYRMEINGSTIGQMRYMPVETVTGSSVTMQAGHAYKIYAMSAAITLNTETIPANSFGLEGHLEIFVAGTGYVVTGSNVVLANALEPDAVNNCTVRFHDGLAIISVEDHVAGYIVVNGSTAGDGSLYYGIATSTNDYVAFDASLNGTTIPLAGAVAEGEKHVVGNGYTETAITGAVDCGTSKFTVANLSLDDVQVTGGTLTLGDAFIPSGSTVAVSGGGLAIEKVSGNGGVIDLGGTNIASLSPVYASGCTFTSGYGQYGGAFHLNANANLVACEVTANTASNPYLGGGMTIGANTTCTLSDCVVDGNGGYFTSGGPFVSGDFLVGTNATLALNGGNTVGIIYDGNLVTVSGSNTIKLIESRVDGGGHSGTVLISSGAILDLTGNTNPTPIAPGGGITFEAGGATIITSAGTIASVSGMTNAIASIGNNATLTKLAEKRFVDGSQPVPVTFTNVELAGGTTSDSFGSILYVANVPVTLNNCILNGAGGNHGAVYLAKNSAGNGLYISGGTITNGPVYSNNTGYVNLSGDIKLNTILNLTTTGTIEIEAGTVLDCTSAIYPALNCIVGIIVVAGDITVKPYGGGADVTITAGTYSKIYPNGTTN